MTDRTNSARVKADAEFRKYQSPIGEREKTLSELEAKTLARDANTARLKALRLEREAAECVPSSERPRG